MVIADNHTGRAVERKPLHHSRKLPSAARQDTVVLCLLHKIENRKQQAQRRLSIVFVWKLKQAHVDAAVNNHHERPVDRHRPQ